MERENMIRPVGAYCDWYDLFDEPEKTLLHDGLQFIVMTSTVVSVIFYLYYECYREGGVLTEKPQSMQSYRNMEYYFTSLHLRNVVMLLTSMEIVQETVKKWFDECIFFAFWETFTSVLEIETLTHVCVERYVIVKYTTNGWRIPNEHYNLYFYLSMMFAMVYAIFYDCDYAGCMCSFGLMLPDIWKRQFIIGLFLLRSVKPTVFIVMMLISSRWMENRLDDSLKTRVDITFTKIIVGITALNLLCWAWFSVIRGWAMLCQVLLPDIILLPSTFSIRWAIWIHSAGPMVTMIAMFFIDHLTRYRCTCAPAPADDRRKKA